MTELGPADPHVRLSLGLYLLGVLEADECAEIERHLAGCAACRAERHELDPALAALELLTAQDARELVDQFGVPESIDAHPTRAGSDPMPPGQPTPQTLGRSADSGATSGSAPATSPGSRPMMSRPDPPPGHAAPTIQESPAGQGRPGPTGPRNRPSRRMPSSRPPKSRRRRTGRLTVAAFGLALVVSFGVLLGLRLAAPGTPASAAGTVTAASDGSAGVSLSVVASSDSAGATAIRATTVGLRDGVRYRLYAVTTDGRTHIVVEWFGSAAPLTVSGSVPVPVNTLVFFTVTQLDGAVIVSAKVVAPSASPGT